MPPERWLHTAFAEADRLCDEPYILRACVKEAGRSDMPDGFAIYYTSQCPFTAKYVPFLEEMAKKRNAAFQAIPILTREQAQNAPVLFTTFSLFYNGEFMTHEIQAEKKFEKIFLEKGFTAGLDNSI